MLNWNQSILTKFGTTDDSFYSLNGLYNWFNSLAIWGFRTASATEQNSRLLSFTISNRQRDFLPTEKRMSMARFVDGFSRLANRVFAVSAVAIEWDVGKSLIGIGAEWASPSKKNEFSSLLIGDSMCAKNIDTAALETKGYCWYKNCNGIKRHLLVDVLGNPHFVHCTKSER